MIAVAVYAHVVGKLYQTTATIATHAAFISIRIVIDHFKIVTIFFTQQHQAIGTGAKSSVAQPAYLFGCKFGYLIFTIINNYKIVSCALVFIKLYVHNKFSVLKR